MWPRAARRNLGNDPKEGEQVKSDDEIREDAINELQSDPQITVPEAIGVAVQDGAVTLTGHVSTYAQRLAAARAAERVYGVKAVANDLKVKLSGAPRDDSDIARAIAHVLEWNVQVPVGKVRARVSDGWVTLEGEVEYEYERHEVERMVRNVKGVVGVTDLITVKPPVSPEKVQAVIEDASSARRRSTPGTSASRSRTTPPSSTGTCTRYTRRPRPGRLPRRRPGWLRWRTVCWSLRNSAGWS
jgi:osmotically-inducible protein OsmY